MFLRYGVSLMHSWGGIIDMMGTSGFANFLPRVIAGERVVIILITCRDFLWKQEGREGGRSLCGFVDRD